LCHSHRYGHNAGDDLSKYWLIRFARLLTVLMSIATVSLAYKAGLEATGHAHAGLLRGTLVGFLPQFTFRGNHVSNDALVATLGAAFAFVLVRLLRRGFTVRLAGTAGVIVGLAYLTKISAICLFPALALAFLIEPAPWRTKLLRNLVLAVPLVIVAPVPFKIAGAKLLFPNSASQALPLYGKKYRFCFQVYDPGCEHSYDSYIDHIVTFFDADWCLKNGIRYFHLPRTDTDLYPNHGLIRAKQIGLLQPVRTVSSSVVYAVHPCLGSLMSSRSQPRLKAPLR
jgi:Dolichyl-phosphate-mannose-protein mannosyltransferase